MQDSEKEKGDKGRGAPSRKPYVPPTLENLGRLRDVTATGSANANEPGSNPGQGSNPNQAKRRP